MMNILYFELFLFTVAIGQMFFERYWTDNQ